MVFPLRLYFHIKEHGEIQTHGVSSLSVSSYKGKWWNTNTWYFLSGCIFIYIRSIVKYKRMVFPLRLYLHFKEHGEKRHSVLSLHLYLFSKSTVKKALSVFSPYVSSPFKEYSKKITRFFPFFCIFISRSMVKYNHRCFLSNCILTWCKDHGEIQIAGVQKAR